MINKKLLSAASLAAIIFSSSAFAKTEGNYVGLNVIRSSLTGKGEDVGSSSIKGKQIGFGVDYKYAINYDNFFVAPGVFAENNNNEGKKSTDTIENNQGIYDKESRSLGYKNKYRYGVKLDIGYDITDQFAVYFTNGLSRNHLQLNNNYSEYTNNNGQINSDQGSSKTKFKKIGYFYGLGATYNVAKDVSVNAEYNIQNINPKPSGYSKIKTNIGVAKIGVAYHF